MISNASFPKKMSNFFELPSENWTFEKIAAHYCFEDDSRIFDRIKKDLMSRSNMEDDSALLAKQLVTSNWKVCFLESTAINSD